MAAAVSIARWLLNEASSGTSPTTVSDDQGSNDLTIDYSSGDANWTSITAGNGLDFTASPASSNSAIAELADIVTNGDIGSSLDGASEASLIFVVNIEGGSDLGARAFHIGTNSGNGDFGVTFRTNEQMDVRWDMEDTSNNFQRYPTPSGLTVVAIVIDTTQATAADRCKVFYNDVQQSIVISGSDINQNSTLGGINSTANSVCIGNRPSQNRNVDAQVYYCELFTGQLTAQEITDSHDSLILDNDANWVSAGNTLVADSGTYTYTGTDAALTADRILTADSGTYTYTGTVVDLLKGVQLTSDSGAYSYVGTDANLLLGSVLEADNGAYTYSGTDATLTFTPVGNFTLTADTGLYTYTGTNAGLLKGSLLAADSGSYTYTGTDATLTFGAVGDFTLTADSGSYVYSGTEAGLTADFILSADTGSYVYTGTAVDLTSGFLLQADSGAYAYSGTNVDFVQQRVLAALTGVYVYNGTDANIFFTPVAPDVPVAKGVNSSGAFGIGISAGGAFGGGVSASATFGSGIGSKGNL